MYRRCLVFAYFAVLALPLFGQETRGMIFGRVVDPSGSPVVNAGVTVRNTGTNIATRLQTNATGYYEANLLLTGAYEVTAEAAGFKKSVRSGIPLSIGARLQVDLHLEIGAVTDSVTVSGEVPLLETNTVSSGRVIDVRNVAELPVARSNPIQLAAFTPGVQTRGDYRTNGHHAANILGAVIYLPNNVGGNEFLIDGVPNTGRNRRVATMPHTDALQEFKIETSGFEASIGHGTGVSFFDDDQGGDQSIPRRGHVAAHAAAVERSTLLPQADLLSQYRAGRGGRRQCPSRCLALATPAPLGPQQ